MKTSVLKASKDAAEQIWQDLEDINEKYGKPYFKRTDFDVDGENGFFVTGLDRTSDGKLRLNDKGKVVRIKIFEYKKTQIGKSVSWDERFLTIE